MRNVKLDMQIKVQIDEELIWHHLNLHKKHKSLQNTHNHTLKLSQMARIPSHYSLIDSASLAPVGIPS